MLMAGLDHTIKQMPSLRNPLSFEIMKAYAKWSLLLAALHYCYKNRSICYY